MTDTKELEIKSDDHLDHDDEDKVREGLDPSKLKRYYYELRIRGIDRALARIYGGLASLFGGLTGIPKDVARDAAKFKKIANSLRKELKGIADDLSRLNLLNFPPAKLLVDEINALIKKYSEKNFLQLIRVAYEKHLEELKEKIWSDPRYTTDEQRQAAYDSLIRNLGLRFIPAPAKKIIVKALNVYRNYQKTLQSLQEEIDFHKQKSEELQESINELLYELEQKNLQITKQKVQAETQSSIINSLNLTIRELQDKLNSQTLSNKDVENELKKQLQYVNILKNRIYNIIKIAKRRQIEFDETIDRLNENIANLKELLKEKEKELKKASKSGEKGGLTKNELLKIKGNIELYKEYIYLYTEYFNSITKIFEEKLSESKKAKPSEIKRFLDDLQHQLNGIFAEEQKLRKRIIEGP